MEVITFRTWNDLAKVREKMKDVKDSENIAVVFDKVSTKTLNVQAIVDEINFIRLGNGYEISEYGFTEPGGDTFGYMYKKKDLLNK